MKCAIVEKVGMTSLFLESGERVGVTVLKVDNCQMIGKRTMESDGYSAIILGAVNVKKVSKPLGGMFAGMGCVPKRYVREFRMSEDEIVDFATDLDVGMFVVGEFLDITGQTVGKGFAGGMKRHGFRGLEASHGVSVSHRSHGSTGGRQDPGKVFKNKKMAGHMGCVRVTMQNIKIVGVDRQLGVLLVHGAVPGCIGSVVLVKSATKR
jgi:large subunit ribosomal protein L3